MGIYDDSLIIISSDHGEAFGENNVYLSHGLTVTFDQISVPLILKPNENWNVEQGAVSIQVSTMDIMPTVLSLCNHEINKSGIDGYSLVKILEKKDEPFVKERTLLSENEVQFALIRPDGLLELKKKDAPARVYYPSIPALIGSLQGKKYYWDTGNEYTLNLTFDQYQRYKITGDIINKFRKNGETFKIIDIGAGIEGNLKKFLPDDNIYFLDKEYPLEYKKKSNYIEGDFTEINLNETYDFVVSMDAYEHIPPLFREKFITNLIKLSKIATIIAAPFDTPGVQEHEVCANELYKSCHGFDHKWLQEHIQNGLPSLEYTIELVKKSGFDYTVIPNGYLPRWYEMMSNYLLIEGIPELSKTMEELFEFYNYNFYNYDNLNPAYRQVIIISKVDKNPDFSDIYSNYPELDKDLNVKSEMLRNLFLKIKIDLSTNLLELNKTLQKKNEIINDLTRKNKEIETSLQEKNSALQSVYQSITWRTLMKYHRIIGKLFPLGTKRRHYYDLCIISLNVIVKEGWRGFLSKLMTFLSLKRVPTIYDSFEYKPNYNEINSVDIILPVHNAFDDTKKCIESVLSFTNMPYRLIIIDDHSTDSRIKDYLGYLANKKIPNIVILFNKENMGFVRTVNKGMTFSKKDIVILNSDTIVTYGWLKKLHGCAYADESIATVTPLSNNATICSIPNICQYNEIPAGYNIQQFGLLVERVSRESGKNCVKIPTAIGFCMYIKRKIIEEIGIFDEIFGMGYNEENDFCMRAHALGYSHVVGLSTFVYHKGMASFKDKQSILEEKNSKLLLSRYPYYMELVQSFIQTNPLKDVQKNIKNKIESNFTHYLTIGFDALLLNRERWTGSEIYMFTIFNNLAKIGDVNYVVYTQREVFNEFYPMGMFRRKFAMDPIDILLDSEPLDVFHRTFQCYSVYDLLLLLKANSSVITIHDLILYHYPSYFYTEQEYISYKKIMQLSLQIADRIIAISNHNKEDIIRNLGVPEDKIDVIYHGVDDRFKLITDVQRLADFKSKYGIKNKYLLYIGTDFPHKNLKNLILAYKRLIETLDNPPDLLISGPSTNINRKKEIISMVQDIRDKIIILDYVKDDDLVNLYNCAQALIFPSLYEGFGLPILEAMACGVPVVASNATSIPEVAGDAGLLVDSTNVTELYEGIYKVVTDSNLRTILINKGFNRVKNFQWGESAKRTRNTYEKAYKAFRNNERKKLSNDTILEIRNLLKSTNSSMNPLVSRTIEDILAKYE